MKIDQIHPLFVGRVTGIDLRVPQDADTIEQIHAAMNQYAVLVLPNQSIDDDQQLAFSEQLGELETTASVSARMKSRKMSDISNVNADNEVASIGDERRNYGLGNLLWHTDSSFYHVPAKYSMLSARVLPPFGGETEFADLRAAYDALPPERQRELASMNAIHSLSHSRAMIGFELTGSRAQIPPATHPLVHRHQGSGRPTLYLASHMSQIEGLPVPEGRVQLFDLMEHATRDRFVYRHHWSPGDLVIWDNRCTMHRGRPFPAGSRREMRRTTLTNGVRLTPLEAPAANSESDQPVMRTAP